MTKLRECPFCGSDELAVFLGAPMFSVVVCQGCSAEANEHQWNHRASDVYAPTEAGLKALRGEG